MISAKFQFESHLQDNCQIKRDLLAEQLHNQAAISWPIIEIDQDNLLPGAENEMAVFERDAKGGAEHCRAHMSVAVAVPPGCIVVVGNAGGRKFFECFGDVFQQAGFIFNGCYAGS